MPDILCPTCGAALTLGPRQWSCSKGHSFDVARQGYVNLLPVTQKHSLHPGDTREQVAARRAFLEAGFYTPLAQAVCQAAQRYGSKARAILDAGCGEGYYSAQVGAALPGATLYGLDISKDAVRLAAGKYKSGTWLCGTAAHLPFPAESLDLILSMFAPTLPGFSLVESCPISFTFTAEGSQIQNLLAMTPHFWRITRVGAQRLAAQSRLTDRASAILNLYHRI